MLSKRLCTAPFFIITTPKVAKKYKIHNNRSNDLAGTETHAGITVFERSLLAFYSAIVFNKHCPSFVWETQPDGLTIIAKEFSVAPVNVTMWAAVTTDGYRDWRLFNCRSAVPGHNCTSCVTLFTSSSCFRDASAVFIYSLHSFLTVVL